MAAKQPRRTKAKYKKVGIDTDASIITKRAQWLGHSGSSVEFHLLASSGASSKVTSSLQPLFSSAASSAAPCFLILLASSCGPRLSPSCLQHACGVCQHNVLKLLLDIYLFETRKCRDSLFLWGSFIRNEELSHLYAYVFLWKSLIRNEELSRFYVFVFLWKSRKLIKPQNFLRSHKIELH